MYDFYRDCVLYYYITNSTFVKLYNLYNHKCDFVAKYEVQMVCGSK